jgi:hypothetical protein
LRRFSIAFFHPKRENPQKLTQFKIIFKPKSPLSLWQSLINSNLIQVCRIPTHLFTFVKFCEMVSISTSTALPATVAVSDNEPAVGSGEEEGKEKKSNKGPTGWGRGMRKCIAEWYNL